MLLRERTQGKGDGSTTNDEDKVVTKSLIGKVAFEERPGEYLEKGYRGQKEGQRLRSWDLESSWHSKEATAEAEGAERTAEGEEARRVWWDRQIHRIYTECGLLFRGAESHWRVCSRGPLTPSAVLRGPSRRTEGRLSKEAGIVTLAFSVCWTALALENSAWFCGSTSPASWHWTLLSQKIRCECVSHSVMSWLFATPWTAVRQTPLPMEFSR